MLVSVLSVPHTHTHTHTHKDKKRIGRKMLAFFITMQF
jgi:hypothetical protein